MAVKAQIRKEEDFIKGGAPVKSEKGQFRMVQLRVPCEYLDKIDEILQDQPWKNRTSWIVEAIDRSIKESN